MKRGFCILLVLCLSVKGYAQAGGVSKNRISNLHSNLIDKRLAKQYSGSNRLLRGDEKQYTFIPIYNGKYKGKYKPMAEAAARKHGVPVNLFNRLIQQESGWNPNAKSSAGAYGLAQLMPATAKSLGVNRRDPRQNLDGGARYLSKMYRKFGNWRHALAAYNAGPEAVAKYNGVPPYKETRNYVRTILGK